MTTTITTALERTLAEGIAAAQGEIHTADLGHAIAPFHFVNGLATAAQTLSRQALGLGAHLVVPPGTWAVVHFPGGRTETYTPGSYWLWGLPGALLVQWVDARRQQVAVGPVEGLSSDKWRVRLWLVVEFAVDDPLLIAAHTAPLQSLLVAVRAATLAYIERHSHTALTGCLAEQGGMDGPALVVQERLVGDAALKGLAIIRVRVVERQGDERQIEAATAATVAAAQIDEHVRVAAAEQRATLQRLEAQTTIGEYEHSLRMATSAAAARERLLTQQAEVQQAALAARLEIVMAQIRAQTAEIAHEEQAWQMEQARLQSEWERVQQQLLVAHQTDQQLRLLDAQQGLVAAEGERALTVQLRQHEHALALSEVQQRIAEQRARQAEALSERRAQHERSLLELHLRHEAMVAEQMQKLDAWRTQQAQGALHQQRQHDRQLAGIAGVAQIAAHAATVATPESEAHALADAGLRMLHGMAE